MLGLEHLDNRTMSLQQTVFIGLGYKARQGKDTVAETIAAKNCHAYNIKVYGFGDELKREVELIGPSKIAFSSGIPLDPNPDMSDPLCQTQWGKQSRVLQHHGEFRRKQDPFYWVRKLRASVEMDNPQIAIIKDVRHLNELYFVKAFGGFTVKVTRIGFVDLSRDPNHVSETQLDNVPFDIEINVPEGGLEQLKTDAQTVFELILAQHRPVDEVQLDEDKVSQSPATKPMVTLC